jgi:alkylresorcinol/alkylpyrone synthase
MAGVADTRPFLAQSPQRKRRATARVQSIAVDAPQHALSSNDAEQLLHEVATRWDVRPEALLRILRHSGIETRHTVYEKTEVIADHSLGERNRAYVATCLELGERVVRRALDCAGLTPRDVDGFISVSCTGFMLPSIDAHLINRLGMRNDIRRLPITELGCAAGAVALARAWEQLQVYPNSNVLILSIELPSLTFQTADRRLSQLVSSMIFADGAAAVVVGPGESGEGPALLGSRTYTIPETLHEMGYDLDENGFHIVLTPAVPDLIKDTIRPEVVALVESHDVSFSDLTWCAMHPAGPKVLKLVAEALDLGANQLAPSWKILKDYGNMSSASVLFVLDEIMQTARPKTGELGTIVAFGPGVSGEIVLGRW